MTTSLRLVILSEAMLAEARAQANLRHPERARFQVDPRLQPGAAKPRAEGSPVK